MKKLIAWLAKGSKIVKILKYIYAALVAANSAVSGIEHGLDVAEKETPKDLQKTSKYLTTCMYALEKILSWFGLDTYLYRDIAQQNLTPEEISARIAEVIDDDSSSETTMVTLQ